MIAVVGIAALLVVIGAVVGIVYFAGNRGRSQDVSDRVSAAKGHQPGTAQTPPRAEGRGDL